MTATHIKYRRLPGRSLTVAERPSLWVGDDHLLKLTNTGYNEEYRRFYFKDIQAFAIARNARRLAWNLTWGLVLLPSLLLARFGGEGGLISGIILSLVAICFLLVNTLLGPTCTCRMKTAVQNEVLPSVGRMRSARKILDILDPRIQEAQAGFAPRATAATPTPPGEPSLVPEREG